MKRSFIFVFSLAAPLLGCGAVDSQLSSVPAVFRQSAPKVAEEERPDIRLLVRNNIEAIFTAAAMPSHISISAPLRAKKGGWTTCVRAATIGITGKTLGVQTYLIGIDHGQIGQRDRVDDATHWCGRETYEPLQIPETASGSKRTTLAASPQ
jgi:hypothetical protein